MINHVRTILAGQNTNTSSVGIYPGYEYAPPNYYPPVIDKSLESLHGFIFGDNRADTAYQNFRLRQVVTLIHSLPELKPYITLLDSRITYELGRDDFFKQAAAGPTITLLSGSGSLYLADYTGNTVSLQLKKQWQIAAIASNKATVTYYALSGAAQTKTFDLTIGANNVSNPISLPESEVSVAIDYNIGTIWNLEILFFPALTLKDIIAKVDSYVSREVELLLFNPAGVEPVTSFSNLWFKHPDAKVRFGALMLALVWHTEEVRA